MAPNRIGEIDMRDLPSIRFQNGAALPIALLMLVILLMLGVATARLGLHSEKIGRNRYARQIAWQAAEAALLDAEYDIGNPGAPRHALFDRGQYPDGEIPSGLYFPTGNPQVPRWKGLGTKNNRLGVDYGSFTAHVMQTGTGLLSARPPRYLIEILPRLVNQPEEDRSMRYRISAVGFGPDPRTAIMLQSIYRRAPSVAQADKSGTISKPSKRLSWREIPMENAS